ncbi:MAG: adenosine kinase [Pseudomonadales bacterium]
MYDVYGLGNALVDMEYTIDEGFLRTHGIPKGHMTLVDEATMERLAAGLDGFSAERMSGGSAANTLIAVQGFGARTFYSCKVADDETGRHFLDDLKRAGVDTNGNAANGEGHSGRCLVLITPDAERSMNTFLGISSQLTRAELDEAALARSRYFYAEGYMSSADGSRDAAIAARELAESEGVKTALSLSDPSMVQFFRDALEDILGNGVDHLFCNEEEALTWARTDRLDVAVTELKDIGRHVNVTLGARGSLAVTPKGQTMVPGFPARAVDTTGAGDIYAGGCLYGWAQGMESAEAAALGNFAAATLIQAYGARLRTRQDYTKTLRAFQQR